jgi:putative transposase
LIGLKKNFDQSLEAKRLLIEPDKCDINISRQCELLGISKSGYYYTPRPESAQNLRIMRIMDEQYLKTPFYGVRRMHAYVKSQGHSVNIKRIRRLLRLMGIEAIYPKPKNNKLLPGHKIYPYLLKGLNINRINQVWSSDISYIPMRLGFMYLVAVIDWYSRYVLSWRLSNSLESRFCLEALEESLQFGSPEIFNTDQGSQFTSESFTGSLESADIKISMDSRGRALDNIFIERLWRSLKYEYVYLNAPETGEELYHGLCEYFDFYNNERFHQSLGYQAPANVYYRKCQVRKKCLEN